MAASQGLGPSLEGTLGRAVDGDSRAFELIYRSYAGRIRAFALARGTRDADAITNDVMLRVFQNLGSFHGDESAFVRWLFTIARNRIIDAYRSEDRRPGVVDAPVPDAVEASAEDVAVGELTTELVFERLSALTMEQREVIALRMIDDLSLLDVAEIVGRPVTAVKALQRRGLRMLQKQILAEEVS